MLETGIRGEQSVTVTQDNTASTLGSGLLDVFATPAMIALLEKTCAQSVLPFLETGYTTVGSRLEISHSAPTPLGGSVRCESELIQIDRRRLVFHVVCSDGCGKVGEGTHERFIVQADNFMGKALARR